MPRLGIAPRVRLFNGTFKTSSAVPPLPTVHTLRACLTTFLNDVDAYTRIFPNVRHVTLYFPKYYACMDPALHKGMRTYSPGMAWSDPSVQSWRTRFLARPQRELDAWPHLQSLRAAGHDAWNVGWAGLARPPHAMPGLARLEMSCSQWQWNDLKEGGGGKQLLVRADAPFVTHLALVFCRSVGD